MPDTRSRILSAAEALMREAGPSGVTFDAVAARIGLSKQAVIYWFPNKAQLMGAVALSCLRAEAEAAITAVEAADTPAEARRAVVLALIDFHLADLPRFRLMYAAPQTGPRPEWAREILDQVHEITGRMYGAIARALGDKPKARPHAVALHMAALGHVLLVGLTEAIGDPLRHPPALLAETLGAIAAAGDLALPAPGT